LKKPVSQHLFLVDDPLHKDLPMNEMRRNVAAIESIASIKRILKLLTPNASLFETGNKMSQKL
jgi:hypothetical protein